MAKIGFAVPGIPGRKGRPKFYRAGSFVRTTTPEHTVRFENLVKTMFCQNFPDRKPIDRTHAVAVEIKAYWPVPKSVPGWKRDLMLSCYLPKITTPDADNVQKAVLDALNGVAYIDDSLVCEIRMRKLYALTPRTEVRILSRRLPQNKAELEVMQLAGPVKA